MEFAVRDLAERLVRRGGCEVTVLTTDAFTNENFRDGSLPRIPIRPDEVQNGVRVRRFPVLTRWAPALRLAQGVAWRLRLPGNDSLRTWYQGPISPALRAAAAAEAADVVLAGSFPLNHLRYAFGRRDRAPVVLLGSIHPWDAWGYERPNLLGLTRIAAATVAHTDSERDWLERHGAPAERVHVIPEGIDAPAGVRRGGFRAQHGIPASAFVVVYVGQQGSHKGIDTLIASLPGLLGASPQSWLVIAGAPTPYSPELRRRADRLPAAARKRLLFLDRIDERQKSQLLEDADVFASPSRHESFGITTLEAWAHRRAVLVADGPAQRELLEAGRLGRLVPYGDAPATVAALADFARSPDVRQALGEAGHERFRERYTLDRVVDQYRDLFEAVSGRP